MLTVARRRFIGGCLGAVAGSVGTALGAFGVARTARAQGKPRTQVRLTAGANLTYATLYVAEATGIFQRHGLDGRVILFDVGFLGTEAVIAGHAETSGTVEFPLVNYLARGADLIVPAVYAKVDELKIVCLRSIRTPADLAGKRIGTIVGSSAEYGLDRFLAKTGIRRDSLKVINVPAAEQVALMARGDIDAYVWNEPVISRGLEVLGERVHVLAPNIDIAYTSRVYLQTARAWTERNPDAMIALLNALIEAERYAKANPKETAEICARKLNLPASDVSRLLQRLGCNWEPHLDDGLIGIFREVAAWMRDNKRLAGEPPDMRRVLEPRYLRQVDPARVTGL
jgi:NitT/TauT family transport system substrate-binding protein